MTEILTESFCERCGTRYTFESARPKTRLKNVRVLSRGFKNFVMSDDTSMDEAMAAARSETDRELTSHQLDAFHKTFNFCMSCRQYTCPNCWNEVENRCLSCAPHLGHEVLPAAFPDLPSGPLVNEETLYTNGTGYGSNGTNGTGGTDHAPELIGMAEVQARHDEEVDAAARLAALTNPVAEVPPVADVPPVEDVVPEPPIAASTSVEVPPVAPAIQTPAVQTPAVQPPAATPPAPLVVAATAADSDPAASPYDDVEAKTPSWLAKLVAVNQVDDVVDARTTPPPTPKPTAAVTPPTPVSTAPVTPTPPPARIEPAPTAPIVPVQAPQPVAEVPAAPLVAAAVPEPVVEAAPELPAETPVAPAAPISIAPAPEPAIEPAAAAAAGLAAAAIHEGDDDAAVEDKAATQTGGLLERFRPAATIAAAAAITPEPVSPEAPAPPMPAAAAAPAVVQPAAVPPPATPAPEAPAPVTPPPAAPSWVPSAPVSTELAAAASAAVPPVRDDLVSQPVWQMVAPDDAPPVAETVQASPPGPTGRPEPQWPTQPEWPSATAASSGLPFLGRPAQPTGGLDALWAESTREVSRQAAGNRATGGVQPCVSCGLSLSANARFCRRCGTPQGA
jgi:hypothetical protein